MSSPIPSYLILSYLFDISSSSPLTFLPSLLSFQVTGVPVGWDEDAERSLLDDSRIAPSVLSSKNGKAVHTKVLGGFTAPFDKNGVLYHIATRGGTEPYQNPHLSGAVSASMSSIYKVNGEKTVINCFEVKQMGVGNLQH